MTTDGGIFKTDDDVSLHFRATSQARAVHDARMAVDAAKEKLPECRGCLTSRRWLPNNMLWCQHCYATVASVTNQGVPA